MGTYRVIRKMSQTLIIYLAINLQVTRRAISVAHVLDFVLAPFIRTEDQYLRLVKTIKNKSCYVT